jgi:EmrB/QacA subfamily drug resistance transporter
MTGTPISGTLSPRQVRLIIGGLLLVLLLAALDSTIVATALPTIVGEMGGLTHLSWVVTAYLLAQTVVTPLYGKLGDLYGRKKVVQVGIVIFLIGSALCGLAQSMTQLIVFRAVQGLGGGGLIVTTQAVIGDVVPPRDRGRYQGIFGAVFGLSSIAGPLIGGYFTTHLSWRWIFYINVPVGIVAILVLAATLPSVSKRVSHAIDYAGAALLATSLSTIIVVTDLGGLTYPWTSPFILSLIAVAVVSTIAFIFVENRANEPVLPLRLFGNRTFVISVLVGLIVGFALFGSVTYLPLFMQVVKGDSPTASGLRMLPMMGGMLVSSIISGQLISRTGKYKIFPIIGTAVMVLGLYLLSRMQAETSLGTTALLMLILGLGLGMVMQVLVLAAQNGVDYKDLGVATSGATLFRLIGGSVGTAVLGAIFASRLHDNLARALPVSIAGSAADAGANVSPRAIAALEPAVRQLYTASFTASLNSVFLIATFIGVAGFALSWFLPETPLRDSVAARAGTVNDEIGEVFPRPGDEEDCVDDERVESEKMLASAHK